MLAAPASLAELTGAFARGLLSPEETLEHALARIDAVDPRLNAFVHVDREGARAAAARSAARWRAGRPSSSIDGAPISVKDMLAVAGLPSRCGSLVTDDRPAAVSAPVVERLIQAGAVIVGLTATAEFGGAPVTISPLSGITRNAHDTARTAGGSSGGAAVSVAAGLCAAAVATDTGGSIRVPAAFNGVVGLKPTGGRIPTTPASALRTLGCPGPIARSVDDCARLFGVMADRRFGADDPACPDLKAMPTPDLRSLRIGASRRLGYAAWIDPQVLASFDETLSLLRGHGCIVHEVEPALDDPIAMFQTATRANYAALLGALADDDVARLSAPVREARAAGLRLSAVDLLHAMQAREDFAAALARELPFDLVLTPMTAVPPFAAERFVPEQPQLQGNPRAWSPFGYPFNLSGQPALTLRCGTTHDGLPIGLQMVAARWHEPLLLACAARIESWLAGAAQPAASEGALA